MGTLQSSKDENESASLDKDRGLPAFITLPDEFSRSECEMVRERMDESLLAPATIGRDRKVDLNARTCKSLRLLREDRSEWLYDRLEQVIDQVNQTFYNFDVDRIEPLELLEYEEGAFFDWHQDIDPGPPAFRKLSLTLQLSDPTEYQGGKLLFPAASPGVLRKDIDGLLAATRGTIVVFPSYQMHQVSPVLSGVRRSVVGWIRGPRFR